MKNIINYTDDNINVIIKSPRIEGENTIFESLVEDETTPKNVSKITFDMSDVKYVNSLGIAEFISIVRFFTNISNGNTKYTFINVDKNIAKLFHIVELGSLVHIEEKDN
ncbi:MAG: hypothetical protein OEZ22_02825 [Spirochaetia bacterium]|nr:hypothetical protein [Spirochaetia bacterium]